MKKFTAKQLIAAILVVIMGITTPLTMTGCSFRPEKKAEETEDKDKGEGDESVTPSTAESYDDFMEDDADAATASTAEEDTATASTATDETEAKNTGIKTGKKAKAGVTSADIIAALGEEKESTLSEETKAFWTGNEIEAAAEDLAWFIAKYPDHAIDYQFYSRCIKKRRKKTGLTDAVSYPLPDQGAYEEIMHRIRTIPGFCDMVAQGLVILAKKSGLKGSQLPAIKAFHKAHTITIKNGKRYEQLKAKMTVLDPETDAYKDAEKKLAEIGNKVGLYAWSEYGSNADGSVNQDVVQTNQTFDEVGAAYVILMLSAFDYTGFEKVDSWFNLYMPYSCVGSDMTTRTIVNKHYQEENQDAFVFFDHDKNGKVTCRFGFNRKDGRFLGITEHWRYVAKHSPPKANRATASTPKGNRDTSTDTTQTTTRTHDRDDDDEEEEEDDERIKKREKEEKISNRRNDETKVPDNKQDGKGVKVQSSGSAQNGNANRNNVYQSSSDGDGEKRSEVVIGKDGNQETVTAGSESSGRRQVTDYNPDYATSAENNYGQATNGSTESKDTSSGPEDGTTTDGAKNDNSGTGADTSVPEAPRESSTPTEATSDGGNWKMNGSMGN